MFCPNCGAQNPDSANVLFCKGCGAQLPQRPLDAPVKHTFDSPVPTGPSAVSGDAPAKQKSKKERKRKEKRKRRKGPVIAVLSVLLALIAAGVAVFIFVFDGSVTNMLGGGSWFEPDEYAKTAPLEMLSAAEHTLFDTTGFSFRLSGDAGNASGTVKWGSNLLNSTILIHWEDRYWTDAGDGDGTYKTEDCYFYLCNGKLYVANGKRRVSGLDLNNAFKEVADLNTLSNELDAFLEDREVNEELRAFILKYDLTKENLKMLRHLVSGYRLNRNAVETALDILVRDFMGGRAASNGESLKERTASTEDFVYNYALNADKLPGFRDLVRIFSNFLATNQAMVSFEVSSDGSAKNGVFKLKVDIPELYCDLMSYLIRDDSAYESFSRMASVVYGEDSAAVKELEKWREDAAAYETYLNSEFTYLTHSMPEPYTVAYATEKGYITSLKISYNNRTLFRLTLSDINSAKLDASEYEFIEEMVGKSSVDDEGFYESLYDLLDSFYRD